MGERETAAHRQKALRWVDGHGICVGRDTEVAKGLKKYRVGREGVGRQGGAASPLAIHLHMGSPPKDVPEPDARLLQAEGFV